MNDKLPARPSSPSVIFTALELDTSTKSIIIPYKLIRKKKIGKFIKFDREVVAIKVNQDIDYHHYQCLYMIELVYVLLVFLLGFEKASLLTCTALLIFLASNSNEK